MGLLHDTAVIVLHFGEALRTIETVRRLRKFSSSASCTVVENGPATLPPAELAGARRIVLGQNLGYGAGNNAGIRAALADRRRFFVVLNNDVVLVPGVLERMRAAAEDPKVGLVGVNMRERAGLVYGGGTVAWWRPRADLQRSPCPVERLAYVHGACLGITRACIDRIGLLPEDLFLYWEDVEYGVRARRAGLKFAVVDGASLVHDDSAGLRSTPAVKTYYLVRNALHVLRRVGPSPAREWVARTLPWRKSWATLRRNAAVVRAIADAQRGVVGPAPPELL